MQASTPGRTPRALVLVIAVLAAALVLAGCQTLRSMSPQARRDAETAARLLQLQQQNMRFADNYVMRLTTAARMAEHRAANPMQRYHLSGWLLAQAVTAYSAASADNAVMGALDLVSLATLSGEVVEVTGPSRFPQQADAMRTVHRELEAEAWKLAADFLTPTQQADLRRVLLDWRAQHMDVETAPFLRFREFVNVTPSTTAQSTTAVPSSLIGLVGLDPMAGLDPAVRQVEQSRLFAERATYYAQRVPFIIDLQLDRSLNRIAVDPDTRALLAQTGSISTSAERFAAVAEALPDEFSKEREALIRQLSELLASQQAILLPMLGRDARGARGRQPHSDLGGRSRAFDRCAGGPAQGAARRRRDARPAVRHHRVHAGGRRHHACRCRTAAADRLDRRAGPATRRHARGERGQGPLADRLPVRARRMADRPAARRPARRPARLPLAGPKNLAWASDP
jgi:hypothetical protein